MESTAAVSGARSRRALALRERRPRSGGAPKPVYDLDGKRVYVAGHRGMVGSASSAASRARAAKSSRQVGRASTSWSRRRPALGWRPTGPTRCSCRGQGRRYPRERHAPGRLPLQQPHDRGEPHRRSPPDRRREAAVPGSSCIYRYSPLSRSSRRAYSRPRWSRRTSPTRSPRSPASSCARPTGASTAATSSPACRPISTAGRTISISRPATSCRR